MKTTFKPPEHIQAQVADFAQEGVEDTGHWEGNERIQLLRNLGEVAAGTSADYTYKRGWGQEYTIPASQYTAHLRRVRGQGNERIQARIEYQQAYEQFRPVVGDMVKQLHAAGPDMDSHKSYIASGHNASTFGFEADGKRYVVKVAYSKQTSTVAVDERLLDLACGKGIPHLEQLAAISYEDSVAVMERMPGKDMWQSDAEDIDAATVPQLEQAITTMRAAQDADVLFDPKPSNYLYDSQEGFGFIDYEPYTKLKPQQPFAEKAKDLADAFASLHNSATNFGVLTSKEDFLNRAHTNKAAVRLLQKYRAACIMQPDQDNFGAALEAIDQHIAGMQQQTSDIETPGWVDHALSAQAERYRQMRELDEEDRRREEAGEDDLVY